MNVMYSRQHTFVGEPGTEATNGFAGFQIGQTYQLRYTRQDSGLVVIELDHLPYQRQLIVQALDFEQWWNRL